MQQKKGLRCKICTGCGLCPGITGAIQKEMHILTKDCLQGESNPFAEGPFRLAVADIGTTTIAMRLYSKTGQEVLGHVSINPQTEYGADVISRIEKASRDEDVRTQMKQSVHAVLEEGLRKFRKTMADEEELILVLAANTTMTYLFMGRNPESLGKAPFFAEHLAPFCTKLLEDTIDCFVFPGLSAFVGGDITAGMLACEMDQREGLTLLVDLGTNGEIALGNREKILCTATAAGPAFEGGVNKGIWGSDMLKNIALLREEGLLDETGLLQDPYFEKGIRVGNVPITNASIRAVQYAKAAIAAGVEVLLQEYGVTMEEVDRIILAGGFGYYLDPKAAGQIGLFPKGSEKKALAGGNTALLGATILGKRLLVCENPEEAFGKSFSFLQKAEVINLATRERFAQIYPERMALCPFSF